MSALRKHYATGSHGTFAQASAQWRGRAVMHRTLGAPGLLQSLLDTGIATIQTSPRLQMAMLTPFRLASTTLILLAVFAPALSFAARSKQMTVSFNSTKFVHRWCKAGQHEFAPEPQTDLAKYTDMLTINVHDKVRTGDELAALANDTLGKYAASGKVLRTTSLPRTQEREAEHFAAVVFARKDMIEVAFARFLLTSGSGLVIVYSKRFVGPDADDEANNWLGKNGLPLEKSLMSWTAMPTLAQLQAIPQSRK